jgi:acetylornithine deacetylase/succinyl-diaminopimelate desuccinylase-like protein
MYGGGAGAILPSQLTSKHNIRYVPVQDGIELTSKIRTQLDRNGYEDVEMRVIGDVPWCKMSYDTDVANALKKTYDIFGISYGEPPAIPQILGGYWPAYLFGRDPLVMPIVAGGAGHGGGAHANNEYYVIEGAGKVYGLAGAEKAFATSLYNFGGKN